MTVDDVSFIADFMNLIHEYRDRVSQESMAIMINTLLDRLSENDGNRNKTEGL